VAKVTITITDDEEGDSFGVSLKFDPPLESDEEATSAQRAVHQPPDTIVVRSDEDE
jgi:hypothetical protein